MGKEKKKKDAANNPFSIKISRHRTDKARLTIDVVLGIENGQYIQGKKSHRHTAHPPINFKLVISEEDLHRLLSYVVNYEFDFRDKLSIFCIMLADAVRQSQIGARGKHKGHETTLYWIKQEASFLHTLFTLINDCDVKPDYFNDLIENIPADERLYFRKGKGYDPVMLTAYQLEERLYGPKKLAAIGLKPFYSGTDSLESFYITYVQPGRKESETFFITKLKPILLQRCGATHFCKEGQKGLLYPIIDVLARRSDMVPCDEKGNEIEVGPIGKKNPHYKEALTELFEEIRKDALFDITFGASHNLPVKE